MKLKRRDFLKEGALVAATGFGLGACRREKTKGEVLSELVRDVVVPDVRSAVAASRQLRKSVDAFSTSPSLPLLTHAREACRTTLSAWKGAHCFRNGTMVETNALLRATFWPARPAATTRAPPARTPISANQTRDRAAS